MALLELEGPTLETAQMAALLGLLAQPIVVVAAVVVVMGPEPSAVVAATAAAES